jgi:hypothetical protein
LQWTARETDGKWVVSALGWGHPAEPPKEVDVVVAEEPVEGFAV